MRQHVIMPLFTACLLVANFATTQAQVPPTIVAQAQVKPHEPSVVMPGLPADYGPIIEARLMLKPTEATGFDLIVEIEPLKRSHSEKKRLADLVVIGNERWKRYKLLQGKARNDDEENEFAEFRKLEQENFASLDEVVARNKQNAEIDALNRQVDALARNAKNEREALQSTAKSSTALNTRVEFILRDYLDTSAKVKGTMQASELNTQMLLKLSLIQTMQNQRIIELLERLIPDKK